MKRLVLIPALLMGLALHGQVLTDPATVAVGREIPRGEVLPCGSEAQAAKLAFEEGEYVKPLKWESVEQGASQGQWRASFKVPFEWADRQVIVRIDRATAAYALTVNGKEAGYVQNGGICAEFDVTKLSHEGNNLLEITVSDFSGARLALENFPHFEQFKPYGNCCIVAQPRVRVRDVVVDAKEQHGSGLLEFGVVMKSHLLNSRKLQVYYDLLDPAGKVIPGGNRDLTIEMRREDTVRFFLNVPSPKLWSAEKPNLYILRIKTKYEGRFIEHLAFPVGFRSVGYAGGSILVNGSPIKVKAQEFEHGVVSTPEEIKSLEKRLEAIKKQGVNLLVVKNGPLQEAFYHACDRVGLYVCDQANIDTHLSGAAITVGGNPSNDPKWVATYVDRAIATCLSSQRHPCVVAYSIARHSANGICLYESYLALKGVEKLRPVIYPEAAGEWNSDLNVSF